MPEESQVLAYTIEEACTKAIISRSELYKAMRKGEVRAVKRGKRTLILREDLRNWVEAMPAYIPKEKLAENEDAKSGE